MGKLGTLCFFTFEPPMPAPDDGPENTRATGETVMRYHLCWKHRDLDGVIALYHPDIQYHDFFQNRVLGYAELRDFFYAEDYHQQYLAKNPGGYCGLGGTGVCLPG